MERIVREATAQPPEKPSEQAAVCDEWPVHRDLQLTAECSKCKGVRQANGLGDGRPPGVSEDLSSHASSFTRNAPIMACLCNRNVPPAHLGACS